MEHQTTSWNECSNCLSNYKENILSCIFCGANMLTGDNPDVALDDVAIHIIINYGGLWRGFLPVPESTDVLVCCQVGLFRFSQHQRVIWDSGIIGLVHYVENLDGKLFVNKQEWAWSSGDLL